LGGAWAVLPSFGVPGLAADSSGRFRDTPSTNLSGETTVIPAKAIKDFAASLQGHLVTMGQADYDQARRLWNEMFDEHPALIARCSGAADVAKSIRFARERDLIVAVRGGGHSYQGYSTHNGGLVLDLSSIRGVRVDTIATTETAIANRGELFQLAIRAFWEDPADAEKKRAEIEQIWARLQPFRTGFYANLTCADQNAMKVNFGLNLPRLARIKKQYDPHNFFRLNPNIRPA
jgi:FAD/FMN-containing dehydrogenase